MNMVLNKNKNKTNLVARKHDNKIEINVIFTGTNMGI